MYLFPWRYHYECVIFLVFLVFICEHKDLLLPKFCKVLFHSLISRNLLTCACYKLELCGCEYKGTLREIQGAIPGEQTLLKYSDTYANVLCKFVLGEPEMHTQDLGTWWVGTECPQPEEASLKGVMNRRFLEGICWEWDWGVAMLYFSWLPFQTSFRHPLDSMRGSGSLREFPDSICIKVLYWMYADCQCCPQEPSWRKHKLCLKSENRQDFISQQSFSIRGIITKCWKLFELR